MGSVYFSGDNLLACFYGYDNINLDGLLGGFEKALFGWIKQKIQSSELTLIFSIKGWSLIRSTHTFFLYIYIYI